MEGTAPLEKLYGWPDTELEKLRGPGKQCKPAFANGPRMDACFSGGWSGNRQ